MKYRCGDLEGNLPLVPQAAEEIHGNDSLEDSTAKGGKACKHE